jgi:hypothetical protein
MIDTYVHTPSLWINRWIGGRIEGICGDAGPSSSRFTVRANACSIDRPVWGGETRISEVTPGRAAAPPRRAAR